MPGFFVGDEDSTAPLTPDDSFTDALTAQFGADAVEAATTPPATAAPDTGSAAGEEGTSPLPSSPASPPPGDSGEGGAEAEVPAPDLEPTPPSDPTGDGFQIADDAAAATATATTPPATPPPAAPDDLDLNELFTTWNNGTKPDRQSMVGLLTFIQQVARLNPQQQAQVNAVIQGQGQQYGAPQYAPQQYAPPPTPPPPASTPSSTTPPSPTPPDYSNLSPEARQILEPIVGEVAALRDQFRQQEIANHQRGLQAQQAQMQAGIAEGSQSFVAQYSSTLSPTDMVLLETRVQQSGQFPYFLSQHGGNPTAAYRALLEATALADPTIRARIVANEAANSPAAVAAEHTRMAKASSVAAGGTTKVSPTTLAGDSATSAVNMSHADRNAAMRDMVQRASGLPSVNSRN